MEIEVTSIGVAAVLIAAAGFFGLWSFKEPKKGAQLILLLLPIYLIRIREALFVPTNMLELLIAAFVLAALLRVILKKEELLSIPKSIKYPLALIFAGALISALRGTILVEGDSSTIQAILGAFKGFLVVPLVFVAAITSLKSLREKTGEIIKWYVYSAVAVAAISVFQAEAILEFLTYDGRLRGFYLSPNHLAMYLMPAAILTAGVTKFKKDKTQIRNISAFVILTTALIWTQSLGALIGLFVGLTLLFGFRKSPKLAGRATQYIVLILITAGIIIPFMGASFAETAWEEGLRSPTASRLMIWRAGEDVLSEHWLLGIGPGAFEYHYLDAQSEFPQYLEWAVPMPHNLSWAFWLQTGLLGLAGFIWLILTVFRYAPKDVYKTAASLALTAILVHGLVDTPFFKNDLAIIFLMVIIGFFPQNLNKDSKKEYET